MVVYGAGQGHSSIKELLLPGHAPAGVASPSEWARRGRAAFFPQRECPNGAGRPSLIYVVYLSFWKRKMDVFTPA